MFKKVTITPAIDLLIPSLSIIKDNLATYFVLAVIPLLLSTYGSRNLQTLDDIFNPLLISASILSVLFLAPLTYAQILTAKGKSIGISKAFTGGLGYFRRLIGMAFIVGFLVIGGMILFILPGVIMLRRYYLSMYYLVDQNLDIKTAMKKSAESSVKNPGAVYGVIGISLLFSMLVILGPLGQVLATILLFLYSVAPALRYHEIKKLNK